MMEECNEKMQQYKKARLIEDRMSYEDLTLMNNFDEDEVTFALNRQIIKLRKDKITLQKAIKLERQLEDVKRISVKSM